MTSSSRRDAPSNRVILSENAINDYLKGEHGSLRLSLEQLCDAIDGEQRGPQTNRSACPLGANTSTAPFAVPPLASLPSQQVLFRQRFLSWPLASAARVCSAGAGSERRWRPLSDAAIPAAWRRCLLCALSNLAADRRLSEIQRRSECSAATLYSRGGLYRS
jgi:hypothetical protein